jgi:NitT/TauT family transport system substrate-binding protein
MPLPDRIAIVQDGEATARIEVRMRRIAVLLILLFGSTAARAEDAISFGLDWLAEAEYGGYYQALATGLYEQHGLKVTIRQGGPQVNQMQLMMAGRLHFNLGGGRAIEFVQQNLPFVVIAAMFQRDPSVLIAHAGQGNDSFAALTGKSIMIGADTRAGWWRFLAGKYGYSDAQIRTYTFNLQPFLADRTLIQQGYLGSEPFAIEQATHEKPVVLLLADAGYAGYANIVTTSTKLVSEKPDVPQRFINASVEGWYSYLYGDPSPANKLIKQDNPEMTDALLAYGREVMKTHGVVDSGDALKLGIGAMTDARWQEFYRSMADVGVYPKGLDVTKAYTLRFVDQRVGMEMKK